jgi:hypothetical protein
MAKRASLIKIKKKPARKSRLQQRIMDTNAMGKEPTVTAQTTNIQMIEVFNWYNYMTDSKTMIAWFKEFLEPKQLKHINKLDEKHINRTIAVLARLLSNENDIPETFKKRLDDHIADLMKMEPPVEEQKSTAQVIPLFKETKGDIAIADLEEAFDNLEHDFSTYTYLTDNDVPKIYCTQIEAYYVRVKDELEAALNKTDKDITESYSNLKKKNIKEMYEYVLSILSDVARYADNKAVARKPRAAKKKSVEDITKHMKCEEKNDEFQIVSIDKSRILKSSELYVFNTKYHTLTHFVAKKGEKLEIHRSSITNFDEEASRSKRIGRKSKEAINIILTGGKLQQKNIFDITNSAFIKIPERINENVVLLSAK